MAAAVSALSSLGVPEADVGVRQGRDRAGRGSRLLPGLLAECGSLQSEEEEEEEEAEPGPSAAAAAEQRREERLRRFRELHMKRVRGTRPGPGPNTEWLALGIGLGDQGSALIALGLFGVGLCPPRFGVVQFEIVPLGVVFSLSVLEFCPVWFQYEACKLNSQEVVEEDKRLKLPPNWEAKKARLEWELQVQEKKKVKNSPRARGVQALTGVTPNPSAN